MNFRNWWLANHMLVEKIANFWLLPKKFKMVIRGIIAGLNAAMQADPTAFTNVAAPENLS